MKLKSFIPDTITLMNLLSGIIGVIFVFDGRPQLAFVMMLAAACFDFMDGAAARLLKAYSDLGKELDSLSDMVSFGVLPSLMMFCCAPSPWRWICLCLALFSALRLAKFNVDTRQSTNFLGIPTPSAAMLSGAVVCYASASPDSMVADFAASVWGLPLLTVILSALLVCEIPMFSLKIKSLRDLPAPLKIFLPVCAGIIAAVLVLRIHLSAVIILFIAAYIIQNLITAIVAHEK
ncbi:MAG: CDP-diacylglycerol--serine O-phosphatidyltransferase [Bacteroidales bacterium]|nr:CDP-diacylglycerol--serine O-phosphatidyltransferase [Bacteroidales bacterium]